MDIATIQDGIPDRAVTRTRAGRPTRAQAEARQDELLEAALDHFLDKGYETATIEAIAAHVGMTKRTVYARYPEKAALFHAAVHRAIERHSISDERIAETDCGDLEQTLRNIARLRIDLVASPQGMKLQRIINTESYRFPEIFKENYEIGALPTIKFLGRLLKRETLAGNLAIAEPAMAANLFISMAVSGPARIIVAGMPLPTQEIDERIAFAVRLFLNGTRPR
jgi:TetR/AcrR family transcriptional regulator, mexJK operon transcriptional repressor